MAKRAPILSENYNPVGARLRSALASASVPDVAPRSEPPRSSPEEVENVLELRPHPPVEKVTEAETIAPLSPNRVGEREIKESYLRFRCTDSERKKWHNITREITGEHNQLSHLMRSCLLILENSYDQLQKMSPEIQRMKRPSSQDAIGLAIYEQRMAQYMFDAIKAAGRPKG